MGLFKSSKPPEPLPSLSLHFDSHPTDHIFLPNSIIAGHVDLTIPIPITPQALEVSFWGLSKVWIRDRSTSNTGNGTGTDYKHYRDIVPLFHVAFNLIPDPHPLKVGEHHTFPFSFRIPEGTSCDRREIYKKPDDDRWTCFPHKLPPTFFFGHDPDTPDNVEVSYGITTRLICPGVGVGKHHEPVSATAPIIFQPLNPHAHDQGISVLKYPKQFTLQSSSLSGQDPSSIGFRKRIQDRFSSSTPKLDFEIGLEIPDLLKSGAEFQFRTSFTVVQKSDNVVQVPAITFRVQKLELLDFTFFRAPRDWNAMNTMAGDPWTGALARSTPGPSLFSEDNGFAEKKTLLNSVPEFQVLRLAEVPEGDKKETVQARHCECWFTARVPGFTVPDFKSFAITRLYRLKVKVAVEIGEKKFAMEAEGHVRNLGGNF